MAKRCWTELQNHQLFLQETAIWIFCLRDRVVAVKVWLEYTCKVMKGITECQGQTRQTLVPTCPVGTQITVEVAWLSCPRMLFVMIHNNNQLINGCGLVPGQTKPGPVKRTPREPSLTCGLPDAAHVPVDSSERGIDEEFLARHSRDRSLLESLCHSSTENKSTSDVSLPGASYMESMMNYIEADRIKPHAVDDEVASRPDERNRLSLPLPMRQDERGYAVGGSNQSLNGTTGPECTQNSDHLPNTSMGNMAHVAAGNFGSSVAEWFRVLDLNSEVPCSNRPPYCYLD